MVKVQIGSSTFVCETAEEAVRVHYLVEGGGVKASPAPGPTSKPASGPGAGRKNARLEEAAITISKLAPYVGRQMSSDELAKFLGAKDASGLGPKMRQLRAALNSGNIDLDEFIEKNEPDGTTPTSWRIVKAAA